MGWKWCQCCKNIPNTTYIHNEHCIYEGLQVQIFDWVKKNNKKEEKKKKKTFIDLIVGKFVFRFENLT